LNTLYPDIGETKYGPIRTREHFQGHYWEYKKGQNLIQANRKQSRMVSFSGPLGGGGIKKEAYEYDPWGATGRGVRVGPLGRDQRKKRPYRRQV
jgi:hypothetical protein